MIIGVDPGIDGAIAVLEDDGTYVEVFDLATVMIISGKKKKRILDEEQIIKDLRLYASEETTVILERVSAMPNNGAVSMFNFGSTYGFLRGVLRGILSPPNLVTPTSWKRHHELIKQPKDSARVLAKEMYPLASLERKKDCDRADALLIADYGRTLL